ncbi:MAG: DUF3419 domain-containing protein, partial [Planctomycetota bacterium]
MHPFNLGDIFEYRSESDTEYLLSTIADSTATRARLVYWNMLVPRSRPASLAHRLRALPAESAALLAQDRAFFHSKLVIE